MQTGTGWTYLCPDSFVVNTLSLIGKSFYLWCWSCLKIKSLQQSQHDGKTWYSPISKQQWKKMYTAVYGWNIVENKNEWNFIFALLAVTKEDLSQILLEGALIFNTTITTFFNCQHSKVLLSCLTEYKISHLGIVVYLNVFLCYCERIYIGHFTYAKRVTVGGFFSQQITIWSLAVI